MSDGEEPEYEVGKHKLSRLVDMLYDRTFCV